ncbi:non-canonical purine NTP pyrophosphatase [Candidatus Saccharibacteria bacterium]|nr:non-canonical purine NTP pyrophosphatase [Candidatus Saccharibacteria bacterium]
MIEKLTLITGNSGKAEEFGRLLGIKVNHVKLDLPEIQHTDVREVSKIKVQTAYGQLKKPVFVDDTGLTFDAWGELPGALIKFFMDNVGNDGLLEMLGDNENRRARVTTSLGYMDENGLKVAIGVVSGTIANAPTGDNGFGYDPIFIPDGQPDGQTKTFAEMTSSEKDNISMRALAAQNLIDQLQ